MLGDCQEEYICTVIQNELTILQILLLRSELVSLSSSVTAFSSEDAVQTEAGFFKSECLIEQWDVLRLDLWLGSF